MITKRTLVAVLALLSFFLLPDVAWAAVPQQESIAEPSAGFTFMSLIRGLLGMAVLIAIAFLFSENRKAISWKVVGVGLAVQIAIAIGVLMIPPVRWFFESVGGLFTSVLDFTKSGSEFLLGDLLNVKKFGFVFAFQILPTILFFSALTSVLFYLGVIQRIVYALAWAMTKLMKLSGAESLSVAGNIFLGQTESPLMIKAYLEKMNRSEILLVMIGGMATVAGGVLASYVGFLGGEDETLRSMYATHLIAASVMAAPGAVVISKILVPQQDEIDTDVKITDDKVGSNILDAMSKGTTEGLNLALNVGAMLLVFFAFIAMINAVFMQAGEWSSLNSTIVEWTGGKHQGLTLQFILGYVFAPLMWLIGVATEDISLVGQLLGEKIIASEFVGYASLAKYKALSFTEGGFMYNKSVVMSTYLLCGFANFASIGIQVGGIGSLAPKQRKLLSQFGMKALIGGTLASLMSATIAGMIIG